MDEFLQALQYAPDSAINLAFPFARTAPATVRVIGSALPLFASA